MWYFEIEIPNLRCIVDRDSMILVECEVFHGEEGVGGGVLVRETEIIGLMNGSCGISTKIFEFVQKWLGIALILVFQMNPFFGLSHIITESNTTRFTHFM